MKKVGFVGCDKAQKRFFLKYFPLPEFKLCFYDAEKDDYRSFDKDLEVLSVFTDYVVTPDIIDFLPKLKLIACRSTGFDNINVGYANKKGVKVANTPGYGRQAVAEYVFALLLNLSRKINITLAEEAEGDEIDRDRERGFNLFGKTLGVIGLGAVGEGVAQIARGFGMNIMAYDPNANTEFVQRNSITLVSDVDDLIKAADVVTLHMSLTRENTHFIDTKRLELMKKSAILVNTARGELVDTVALVAALRNGRLAGAALDVVEDEYLLDPAEFIKFVSEETDGRRALALRHAVAILALERMHNVIITNHNAFNTDEAVQAINKMTVENIRGIFNGQRIYEVKL
jgi:D-lactate dehydrogenase